MGRATALLLASEGAKVAVTDLDLAACEAVAAEAGPNAKAFALDVADGEAIKATVAAIAAHFGGIDILINNASAISLTGTLETPMKRYDLMHQINVRGTFACSQACLPHLLKAENPHILNLSPPLNFEARWFAPHVAYSIAKFGMSLCVLGMAEEFRSDGVAVNALWPRTTIATAAVNNLLGGETIMRGSRKPDIMGDAAHFVLTRPSRSCTGNYFVDDEVLASEGITNLDHYANVPGEMLIPDFFV